MERLGKDLGEGSQEPRGPSPPASTDAFIPLCLRSAIIKLGLGQFTVTMADRVQFLGPVAAHTHDEQGTQPRALQANVMPSAYM